MLEGDFYKIFGYHKRVSVRAVIDGLDEVGFAHLSTTAYFGCFRIYTTPVCVLYSETMQFSLFLTHVLHVCVNRSVFLCDLSN